jgi:hypothetical protein
MPQALTLDDMSPRLRKVVGRESPRVTSTEEPDGGNLLVRIWRGAGVGNLPAYSTTAFSTDHRAILRCTSWRTPCQGVPEAPRASGGPALDAAGRPQARATRTAPGDGEEVRLGLRFRRGLMQSDESC